MSKPRYTIPTYIEGEEVGGIIVGKWIEPGVNPLADKIKDKNGHPALMQSGDLPKNKGKAYEVPLNPLRGKVLGVEFSGGIVQMPNKAKNKREVYRLPNFLYITIRMMVLLLTVFQGYEIIGLWHTHPPGKPEMSEQDHIAIDNYLRKWGTDKMLFGLECDGVMDLRIIRPDTRMLKWNKQKH